MTNTTVRNIWQSHKLGEMAEEVRNLFEPIGAGEYPYVGLEHIEQGTLQLNSIGKSTDTVSTKKQFNAGEILFGSLRPYFRKVVRLNFNGVCSTDITVIRPKKNCNSGFLQYFIANQAFIDHATNISSGTRMPRANWKTLCESEWEFPLLPTQRKIAAILSGYDDLIENNLRRIKILEETAQNLYREWFIKFRFPGHQHARFTDSLLGRIPEGWDVVQLGEVADVRWGDTSTTKSSYVRDGYTAYSATGADGALEHYDYDRDGIVLSAIGANCGITWFASGKWSCIKNTIRFWSSNPRVSTEYLFYATLGKNFWPKRGAAQPFISQGDAKGIAIVIPYKDMNQQFEDFIKPTLAQFRSLSKKNTTLRRTRDLLLPRLISGEVDVSELDIAVPEEASA